MSVNQGKKAMTGESVKEHDIRWMTEAIKSATYTGNEKLRAAALRNLEQLKKQVPRRDR